MCRIPGEVWGLAATAESSAVPLRPEAAPPALLAWADSANSTCGADSSGRSTAHGTASFEMLGSLIVSCHGGPHTLYRASRVAGVRALVPACQQRLPSPRARLQTRNSALLCTEVLSASQELVLEPLPGPSAATFAQPSTRAAGTVLVSGPSPAQARPSALADRTAAAAAAKDPTAHRRQAAAAPDWASLRTWPHVSAAEPANSLSQTCESAAQAPAAGAPRHTDPPQGAPGDLAWSAGSSGHLRSFPCYADVPQHALIQGMAAVNCYSAAGGSRPSVALFDSAGRVSVVPVNVA